ncbi:MAG TPA: hypothetical protein DD405_07175 [Desulfobacteraceae bacterium]|nr:hypothetical protein [Desulfobacteraceae bacterium]
MKNDEILKLRIDNDAFDENMTIKGFLHLLLKTLWEEGECFSGKRPFGNSGWEYDLYKPLIQAYIISGEIDEDGDIETFDEKEGNRVISELIAACFDV